MKVGSPTEAGAPEPLKRVGPTASGATGPGQVVPVDAAATRSGKGPVDAVAPADSVHISNESRALGAKQNADDTIREEKVRELKSAIEEKRYKVDVHAIADKMIKESAGLLEAISSRKVDAEAIRNGAKDPASNVPQPQAKR